MKTCPVCKSLCFDDMSVCYGCMHDFDRDIPDEPEEAVPPVRPSAASAASYGSSGASAASSAATDVPMAQDSDGGAQGFPRSQNGLGGALHAAGFAARDAGAFGSSGSAVSADAVSRPVMSLPIPMLTSAFASGARSDETARIPQANRQRSAHAVPHPSCSEAMPCLTFEAPAGCRMVFRLEPA